eukprot:305796-Amphidinium_carterae.2
MPKNGKRYLGASVALSSIVKHACGIGKPGAVLDKGQKSAGKKAHKKNAPKWKKQKMGNVRF